MKRLLHWLSFVRANRPLRQPLSSTLLAAPLAPDWTKDHQAEWARILSTEVGIDFLKRFRAVAASVAASSCADAFHSSHSAGTAHGWNEALQWVHSLSQSSRVSGEATPEPNQAPYSHPFGRDELVELYAP